MGTVARGGRRTRLLAVGADRARGDRGAGPGAPLGAAHIRVNDPQAAQFRLFDAYASMVRRLSERSLLLLVLDDLHWSDKPSLLLLQHRARELGRMRVLVVGTNRDTV